MGLDNCPFCGSNDVEFIRPFNLFFAECHTCGASSSAFKHPDLAANAWNRRAIDIDALRKVVAEIEGADVDGDGDWSERIRKAVGL